MSAKPSYPTNNFLIGNIKTLLTKKVVVPIYEHISKITFNISIK